MTTSNSSEVVSKSKSDTLAAFEKFGQQFLAQFAPMPGSQKYSKAERRDKSRKRKANEQLENPTRKKRATSPLILPYHLQEEDGDDFEDTDEEVNSDVGREEEEDNIIQQSSYSVPVVVYGAEQRGKTAQSGDRRFMSSKISKLRSDQPASSSGMSKKEKKEEIESMENDRTLYKLIHSKLLTTSLDDPLALDVRSSKKKKSLEGRVLEVANAAKIGKGEVNVRRKEHAKAPRRIREGIEKKKKEINHMKLQEAKDAGNYHPAIKKLLAGDSERPKKTMRRERGIGMGVGSFKGGTLALSKQEIKKAQGYGSHHRPSKGRKKR
ncbi:hypothetical protein FRB91_009646 [Serendipita sp. 411]|nr:hypothetical protein FRB91_009646 [Serendipita sp. 411]